MGGFKILKTEMSIVSCISPLWKFTEFDWREGGGGEGANTLLQSCAHAHCQELQYFLKLAADGNGS